MQENPRDHEELAGIRVIPPVKERDRVNQTMNVGQVIAEVLDLQDFRAKREACAQEMKAAGLPGEIRDSVYYHGSQGIDFEELMDEKTLQIVKAVQIFKKHFPD